jgi:hypothetical protein
MTHKQRLKALLASAIFPGTGQMIAGDTVKAVIIQVVFVGLLFGVVLVRPDLLPHGLAAPGAVWLLSLADLLLRDVSE